MRTEQEMLDLILNTAIQDDRIRVVLMTGSRTNPNVKKDIFQDYDIVYIVRDIESFTSDPSWVDLFGERIMMQMPEDKVLPPASNDGNFIYLMGFKDGNRIDLTLTPIEKMDTLLKLDSLSKVHLDKDEIIGNLLPSSDKDYLVKRPSEKEFQDLCNEYWWICMNIAKGIWREELTYTMFMYEQVNRNVLIRMTQWYIGIQTDFAVSSGKLGKYFKDFLTQEEWKEFQATYSNANYENIWESLFTMCNLYRKFAINVAEHFNFAYPFEDDNNVTEYLHRIKNLPKDAKAIG